MATNVTNTYLHVVDDVIKNVRAEFQSEGVDENVLQELQALWELKLMQSGAIVAPPQEGDDAPDVNATAGLGGLAGHDLNMPYEAAEEEFRTQDLLPSEPVQQQPQTAHRPAVQAAAKYQPPTHYSTGFDLEPTLGRPESHLAKPELWNRQSAAIDLNSGLEGDEEEPEYKAGDGVTQDFFSAERKRRKVDGEQGFIPQTDGADDPRGAQEGGSLSIGTPAEEENQKWLREWEAMKRRRRTLSLAQLNAQRLHADSLLHQAIAERPLGRAFISQNDGASDEEDDGEEDDEGGVDDGDQEEPEEEEEEDYNVAGDQTELAVAPPEAAGSLEEQEEEDDEPPLGAGDDDEDDEDEPGSNQEDPATDNLVLATYDKVTRAKNKWKCVLKDCIMHLNGKDLLIVKASGEFEF